MNKIKAMMFLATGFIAGALALNVYATKVNLIMIPDTIGGYSTLDLLSYLAQLRSQDTKLPTAILGCVSNVKFSIINGQSCANSYVPTPVPFKPTEDQLIKAYTSDHLRPVCDMRVPYYQQKARMEKCASDATTYNDAMNNWVQQQESNYNNGQ